MEASYHRRFMSFLPTLVFDLIPDMSSYKASHCPFRPLADWIKCDAFRLVPPRISHDFARAFSFF